MKKSLGILALLFFLCPLSARGEADPPDESLGFLIRAAENEFYQVDHPDRYARTGATLALLEKLYPKEPYVYWAKARLVFFQKEDYYLLPKDDLEKQKLEMANICHQNADQCLKLAPQNAECHLLKGSCYAMQASTWGNSFKSLRVCNPMDHEWARAMELPSDFVHPGGTTTRQFAQILRAILHRILPDSFWFRFLAGVRGNKELAYRWLEEAVTGAIAKEPMIVLERSVATICYARQKKSHELEAKGMDELREGVKLPTRYAMDDYDKKNMARVLEYPEEACKYSREAFRDFSEKTLKSQKP